jgi:ribokinase
MNNFEAVGFGALNVDRLYKVNKIAREDEESFITDFNESCGGSASNTMVGLSRLGVKTGFIGKIADDMEGNLILNNFSKESVDNDGILISQKGRTGNALVFVDQEGQRALYVDPGVNDSIKDDDIDINYLSGVKILHLTSFVGDSIISQEHLLKRISKDIIISFDPGRIYAERGMDYIINILERTNIILLNERELEFLIESEGKYKSFEEASKILLEKGVKIVVVKRGEKGTYVSDGNQDHLIDTYKVKCVDTTGAGDAFNAGFLYGIIKEKNLEESCKLGNFVASQCIKELGAINGLPNRC